MIFVPGGCSGKGAPEWTLQRGCFTDTSIGRRGTKVGSFEGKTILVTGGAMGIGAATVKRLVHEEARVIIADIDEEAAAALLSTLESGKALFQRVDLSDPRSFEAMGREAAS